MFEEYNEKSCSVFEKTYYKPIEAALRWCGLSKHEETILQTVGGSLFPPVNAFPKWPCLRANTEKIYDAILSGDLPHGRDGRTVATGDHVAKERLTIRHADLKSWMIKFYPDQKPKFLFDEIERNIHSAINVESFMTLQAEHDALKIRIDNATDAYRKLKQERDTIAKERDSLQNMVGKAMTTNERNTLLTIIAAICNFSGIKYQERGAAQRIMKMTDDIGTHIDDGTIRSVLIKISDALETRMK